MDGQIPPQDNISEELYRLGRNINAFVKTAWESPERQKIQSELENHLMDLGSNLEQAAQELASSPAGKQIKEELDEFGQRLADGEVENKVKSEFVSLLDLINRQIEQASSQRSSEDNAEDQPRP